MVAKQVPESLVVLGLDPGVARLGFGAVAWQGSKISCLGYGCLTTPKEMDLPNRLLSLAQELRELLIKYQPTVVGVETLRFAQNQTTGIAVAEARGLILTAAAGAGRLIIEISPLQVKQSLTAYGQADKQQVQKMVQRLLKLTDLPQPDDAADALAVAIAVEPIYRQQKLISSTSQTR
jgi:crossover junction endodeoxyribonuclease RuvC